MTTNDDNGNQVATKCQPPVYCSRCRCVKSYERKPEQDIYGEAPNGDSVLMWLAYACKMCGRGTIRRNGVR